MEQQDNGALTPEAPATPTEAEPLLTAPQAEETESPAGEKDPPAEKTFTQKELDEILAKKTAKLIRQREQERARREVYEQQLTKAAAPQPASGEPQPEQFADPRQYARAVVAFEREQEALQQQAQHAQRAQSTFTAKRDDLMAELEEADGFDKRKWESLPITVPMAEAILDSELGTKLALHLTQHPDEASRIATLSPARQAAEIGKLEAKLSPVASKKPSNAPDPIRPVGGKGSSVTSDIYDPKLASDTAAWIAARNAQLKARR